jgi:DNA invertase Pin-like site-specific DNA recombinase
MSKSNVPLVSPKRCAVYCRVSSDERLDQSFNSIDAQREAGHAFIKSQSHEGWIPVPDDYEDAGFSGGNMDRPALKRLLSDIEMGRVDVVVIYKIDRLSRSLADFARMVETFDRYKVSFSAVTQQINSATSMGRLMLNVLLSFAQFEREVTSERIRDKFAASKAKGIWMGGPVPLGYDVKSRLLIVNEPEAEIVRRIFDEFVSERSSTKLVRNFAAEGVVTKSKRRFCKQSIYKILRNPIYLGKLPHKGKLYPGNHQAIITQAQWDAAHAILAENPRDRRAESMLGRKIDLLRGLLWSSDGERFLPTRGSSKNRKHYRYYSPARDRHYGAGSSTFGSIPAESIENLVLEQVYAALRAPHIVQAVWDRVREIDSTITEPEVVLPMMRLSTVWKQLFPAEQNRLIRLLIERVVLSQEGMEIVWRIGGWASLADELVPGTIGAELAELEVV